MSEPLLVLDKASRHYPSRNGNERIVALDRVSLSLPMGAALGVMGPSGAGKSTLARLALGMEPPSAGRVLFRGSDPTEMSRERRRRMRREVQIIWQDPTVYLNPYYTVKQLITEPMEIFGLGRPDRRRERAARLLETVGLSADYLGARPNELSGGQCQRAAMARALAVEPKLLICDEALSSLDLPQQVRMLRLLARLQVELGLAYLFISHDPDLVRILCPRSLLIQRGRVLAQGRTRDVLAAYEDRPGRSGAS